MKELTSSQADSPVKTSALQESRLASRVTGRVFGAKCTALLGYYDQSTQSLKTYQGSLALMAEEISNEYSAILPTSGMMRNGKLFQQEELELGILDEGSGLLLIPELEEDKTMWRTPDTCAGGQMNECHIERAVENLKKGIHPHTLRLQDQVLDERLHPKQKEK